MLRKTTALLMSGVVMFSSSVYASGGIGASSQRANVPAGIRDIVYNSGFAIGVFGVGHGIFKLYHMWFSPGMVSTDRTSNTTCTYIEKPVEILIATERRLSGGNCSPYRGLYGDLTGMYKCNVNGQEVTTDSEGNIYNRTVIHGSACKRTLTKEYFETTITYKGTNLTQSIGANGEPYFQGLSFKGAVDLMVSYMRASNIPYGLFAVHDIETEQRRRRGFLRNRITITFYEKPKFYAIIKDAGVGQHLGYGYYLIEEGQFNDFIKNRTYLDRISRSGWSFFGNLFFFAITAAIAAFALPALGIGGLAAGAGSMTGFFYTPVFLSTFGVQVGMYAIRIGSTGATTTGPWNALLAPDNYERINGVNNPGTNALRNKIANENEDNSSLSGFREAWHVRKSQESSTRAPAYFYNY